MSYYGILKSAVSTGADSELLCKFAAPLNIINNAPSFSGDALSLRRVTSRSPSQRWEIETNVMPESDPSEMFAASIIAGNSEIIYIRMPQVVGRKKLAPNTVLKVSSAAAKGASTVVISGHGTQVISKGEFISFTGDAKVYAVVGHVGANLEIYPRLRKDLPANTSIAHSDNVVMQASYGSGVKTGITYVDGILANPGTLNLIERL